MQSSPGVESTHVCVSERTLPVYRIAPMCACDCVCVAWPICRKCLFVSDSILGKAIFNLVK